MNVFLILNTILFLYLFFRYFLKKDFSKRELKIILVLFVIFLTGLAISLYPKTTSEFPVKTFDLFRYYFQMDDLRKVTFVGALSFIFEKIWFGFRIIEYIVAILFKSNDMIFIITLPLTLGIYSYILYDIYKNNKLSKKQVIVSIVLFLSIVNPLHLFSGIRNALAVSIYSLGLYNAKIKLKKSGYIYCILSVLIHPMTLIYMGFELVVIVLKKFKYSSIFLISIFLLFPLLVFCVNALDSIISLPSFIVEKLNYYSVEANYYNKKILILELIQIFIILEMLIKIHKKKNDKFKMITYLYYLTFLIIGFIPQSTFFIRLKFLLAYFTPYIFCIKNDYKIKLKNRLFILFGVSIVVFMYYLLYIFDAIGGILL